MLDFPGPGGLTLGQVFTSAGKSWQWDGAKWGPAAGGGAPLDSPSFTGDPKAPTPATADNDTSIATSAFVKAQGYLTGNQSITLSGDITGAGTTAIAATLATVNADVGAFQGLTLDAKGRVTAAANQGYQTAAQVTAALAPYAPLAAPVFTGDARAVTPATADNDTSIATTAFVKAQGYVTGGPYLPTAGGTVSGALTTNGGIANNGGLVQANNQPVYGKDTGGTARSMISLAGDNILYISDGIGRGVVIQDTVVANGSVQTKGSVGGFALYDRGTPANYYNVYGTGNTYRITSSVAGGDVLILDTAGNITLTGLTASKGYGAKAGVSGAQSGSYFNFNWTGSLQAWLDTTNLGTVTLTCDYRIKDNIADLPSTWDKVRALRPVSYTRKENPELLMMEADPAERWGFIAHELQEALLPTAATGVKDEPNLIQSPDVMVLLATVTRALQEAMLRIEQLEGAR